MKFEILSPFISQIPSKIPCMMQIKIPLFLPVNDENSFNQNFFLVRRQSGRVKRHAYSYVFLLRPPLPKARSRGGRQFFIYTQNLRLGPKYRSDSIRNGKSTPKMYF